MLREIKEELNLEVQNFQIGTPIVTYTPITEKSAKHMGIIFPVFIEKSINTRFSDGKCRFVDIGELDEIENFESWSEIIYSQLLLVKGTDLKSANK